MDALDSVWSAFLSAVAGDKWLDYLLDSFDMAAISLSFSRTTWISRIQAVSMRNTAPVATTLFSTLLLPRIESILELFPPWLLAVPKKKTSHSRKGMRSANKGLKDKNSQLTLSYES
jgi:hypothetical protein